MEIVFKIAFFAIPIGIWFWGYFVGRNAEKKQINFWGQKNYTKGIK